MRKIFTNFHPYYFLKWAAVYLIVITATACGSNGHEQPDEQKADTESPSAPTVQAPVADCYRKIHDRDSIRVRFESENGRIRGTLEFDNYQIDGSSGKIEGSIHGDTLKVWYDFHSEGMRSVREIYFLRKGDHLVRGIGDEIIRNDTSFLANPPAIMFPDNEIFLKVDCANF